MGNNSKSSLILGFNGQNDDVIISGVNGTVILDKFVSDFLITIDLRGIYSSPTYVLSTTDSAYVSDCEYIIGNTIYIPKLSTSGNNSRLVINVFRSNGKSILFSNVRSLIDRAMVLEMTILMVPPKSLQEVKAINFDFQTIESTEKTRNINVYAGNNGETNYYNTAIPIPVTMGVITNLSQETGDFMLNMYVTNGVVKDDPLGRPWFITDITYNDNKLVITCSESRTVSLISKISWCSEGFPPIFLSRPTYSLNVITVDLLGTKLSTVKDYTFIVTLLISVF
jgi:hypothetical protein